MQTKNSVTKIELPAIVETLQVKEFQGMLWGQTIKVYTREYSASIRVRLCPDVVEYPRGGTLPLYNLIIGKQTLHDLGAVLDFKEKTITINEILLPMRNINNLQLKPSISSFPGHSNRTSVWPRN
jgi:hypothetical protein